MEISNIVKVFEKLQAIENLPDLDNQIVVDTDSAYKSLVWINDETNGDVEDIGEALEMSAIDEMGLVPVRLIEQAKKYGLRIEKVDRKIHQFDYVICSNSFGIFFGS